MGSLKRAALGGESFFMTTFTAGQGGGWVDFAAALPGGIAVQTVAPEIGLNISRGSYLCSESSVEIDTKWGGFKNLFGSEGGFLDARQRLRRGGRRLLRRAREGHARGRRAVHRSTPGTWSPTTRACR